MTRSRWFSDESVELIKKHCVAFAFDWTDPDAKHVSENLATGGNLLVTPGEKLLGGDLAKGLEAWNNLPEEERRPGAVRVEGKSSDALPFPSQTLVLSVYGMPLIRTADGKFSSGDTYEPYKLPLEPTRDVLWVRDEEWKSFLPDRPKKGDRFLLPRTVFNRICAHHLQDWFVGFPYSCQMAQTVHAFPGEIALTAEEVTPDVVRMRVQGSARVHFSRDCRFRFGGSAEVDLKKKTFTRFKIVAHGEFTDATPESVPLCRPKGSTVHLGFLFDLVPTRTPFDLIYPGAWSFIGEKYYDTADPK